MTDIVQIARDACREHKGSDIETAIHFFEHLLPAFVGTSNDRLVKAGRSIVSLMELEEDGENFPLKESLELVLEEAKTLLGPIVVPKVRFGKTELQMPVVTMGCMRFQQEWGPRITEMNQVGSDCQDNLVAIIKAAIGFGINHIETARGYGSSELQIGAALKQLFLAKTVKREDLIIQTKIPPNANVSEFRKAVETSLRNLQVDYVDLFAFHGMNFPKQLDWLFSGEENCWTVIQEFKKAGRIKHIGFSTHGSTDFIVELIKKDCFDYVNLHYHYFGSYTASGGGHDGNGNLDCVKLLREKDMGIFIISPFDKGGRLYAPSRTLRSLTLPEMEPMFFKCFWIWNHHRIGDGTLPQLHTFTVGAARAADLDQPAVAAHWYATKPEETLVKLQTVKNRLDSTMENVLGKEWVQSWWKGLPKASACKSSIEHNQIVWIYNSIKAFGMYEFGKARYSSFEGNGSKWDKSLPLEKNIENVGANAWGFVPGLPLEPAANYDEDLVNVPAENLQRVKEAEAFVLKWCAKKRRDKENGETPSEEEERLIHRFRRNFSVSTQSFRLPSFLARSSAPEPALLDDVQPEGWETAYDMRPWPDYPDQPSRA